MQENPSLLNSVKRIIEKERLKGNAKCKTVGFVDIFKSNESEEIHRIYTSDEPLFRLVNFSKDPDKLLESIQCDELPPVSTELFSQNADVCKSFKNELHENSSSLKTTLSPLKLLEKLKKNDFSALSTQELTDYIDSYKPCTHEKRIAFSYDFKVGKDSRKRFKKYDFCALCTNKSADCTNSDKSCVSVATSNTVKPKNVSKTGTDSVNEERSQDDQSSSGNSSDDSSSTDTSFSDSDSYDKSSSERSTNKIEDLEMPSKSKSTKPVSSNSKNNLKVISAPLSIDSLNRLSDNDSNNFSVTQNIIPSMEDNYRNGKYNIKRSDTYIKNKNVKSAKKNRTFINPLVSFHQKCIIDKTILPEDHPWFSMISDCLLFPEQVFMVDKCTDIENDLFTSPEISTNSHISHLPYKTISAQKNNSNQQLPYKECPFSVYLVCLSVLNRVRPLSNNKADKSTQTNIATEE